MRARALFLALLIPGLSPSPTTAAPEPLTRASIQVRTLVIDALGTRTVDTHAARVPFGHRGLIVRQVPYAGPPVSFRLRVTPGDPQSAGLPLTFITEVWSGEASPVPPPSRISFREEATVLSPESSYLLELYHEPRTDRRLLLSIKAHPIGEQEELIPPPPADKAGEILFLIEILKRRGDVVEPVDSHVLSTIVGRPVSYRSGIEVPDAQFPAEESTGLVADRGTRVVGASVVLTPERAQGGLITVKLEFTGADFVDNQRTRIEPFELSEVRTVSSGSRFEAEVSVPGETDPREPGIIPVIYKVSVTTMLRERSVRGR